MASVQALAERLQEVTMLSEKEISYWVYSSEIIRSKGFYGDNDDAARGYVRRIADILVAKYLSNANENEVPLPCKTRIVLIFSNFCLYKPVRSCIYDVLDKIGAILEEAIRIDAQRPFNPELGRISEHVLVLLMRVTGYKLKAAYVHEFSDDNTQFAVQLLLAILLKEPSYETALRCNALTAILGFTQPQAFFNASDALREAPCEDFTKKINFILNLMLRVRAMEVVNDDLMSQLDESETVSSLLHVAVCSTMRCVMNIFRFSTESSLQWRQHILLSTSLLETVVSPYIHKQCEALHLGLTAHPPAISTDIVHGISLAFKFWCLCTFRMNHIGRETRFFCLFFIELLYFSIRPLAHDAAASNALMRMYISMFHCMSTIDALGGEKNLQCENLIDALRSDSLRLSIEQFLYREVAPSGLSVIQEWHKELHQVDADVLVNRDSETFSFIEKTFADLEVQATTSVTPAAPSDLADARKFLKELPPLKKPTQKKQKISIEKAAAPVESAQPISVVRKDVVDGVDSLLLCALTGNVMKNPVISPHGHTFEKESILSWIQQNGSICPITGKELPVETLVPNKEVAGKIMRQVILQSMSSYNQEDQADLYDF